MGAAFINYFGDDLNTGTLKRRDIENFHTLLPKQAPRFDDVMCPFCLVGRRYRDGIRSDPSRETGRVHRPTWR